MVAEAITNNAQTTLNGSISNAVTTIVISSATSFPQSGQYRIIVDSEIMIVTGGQGTTSWTVTRGAESTVAAAHNSAAVVSHIITAGGISNLAGSTYWSNFAPAGLTGATAASRYAGATTGGKPASGTFIAGDYIVDQTGIFWVCTVGGSPGTWLSPSMGEVSRTNLTVNSAAIVTTAPPGTNVTTLVYTFSNRRKYRIRAFGTVVLSGAGAIAAAALFTAAPGAANVQAQCNVQVAGAGGQAPFYVEYEADGTLNASTTISLNGWVTAGNVIFSGSTPPAAAATQTVITIDDIGQA